MGVLAEEETHQPTPKDSGSTGDANGSLLHRFSLYTSYTFIEYTSLTLGGLVFSQAELDWLIWWLKSRVMCASWCMFPVLKACDNATATDPHLYTKACSIQLNPLSVCQCASLADSENSWALKLASLVFLLLSTDTELYQKIRVISQSSALSTCSHWKQFAWQCTALEQNKVLSTGSGKKSPNIASPTEHMFCFA